jgi:hypothetical protein
MSLPKDRLLAVNVEINQLETNRTSLTRGGQHLGGWYTHGAQVQGFTNRGQIPGTGYGPGMNMQLLQADIFDSRGGVSFKAARIAYHNSKVDQFFENIQQANPERVEPWEVRNIELLLGARITAFLDHGIDDTDDFIDAYAMRKFLQGFTTLYPEVAGILTAIAVAASAGGNLACGQLLARGFRHLHLLVFSFAIMAIGGFAVLSEGAPFALAYGAALLFAFAAGLVPVIVIDSVPRFAPRPDLAGVTIGFVTQGNGIGMLVGPVLAGTLAANAGWTSVALVLALAGIAATVLARFLFRRAQAYPAL